jgi:hypothetical protein
MLFVPWNNALLIRYRKGYWAPPAHMNGTRAVFPAALKSAILLDTDTRSNVAAIVSIRNAFLLFKKQRYSGFVCVLAHPNLFILKRLDSIAGVLALANVLSLAIVLYKAVCCTRIIAGTSFLSLLGSHTGAEGMAIAQTIQI